MISNLLSHRTEIVIIKKKLIILGLIMFASFVLIIVMIRPINLDISDMDSSSLNIEFRKQISDYSIVYSEEEVEVILEYLEDYKYRRRLIPRKFAISVPDKSFDIRLSGFIENEMVILNYLISEDDIWCEGSIGDFKNLKVIDDETRTNELFEFLSNEQY